MGAAFVFAGSGCKKPDAKSQTRNELQKIYDEQAAAMAKKDINGTLAHHAPDYVTISAQGKTHDLNAERQDFLTAFNAPISNMQFGTTIHDVTLDSNTQAVVTATRTATGGVSANGKSGVVAMNAELRDLWVKGAQGWQLKREKLISMKATLDGKPLR